MLYLCTRKTEINTVTKAKQGALVQLVRIHACHAWGHGFESRTHRQQYNDRSYYSFGFLFFVVSLKTLPNQDSNSFQN